MLGASWGRLVGLSLSALVLYLVALRSTLLPRFGMSSSIVGIAGIGTKLGSSALCQPCQATRECGFLEQSLAPTGLSALIFGSTRSVQFDMECRANVCVPTIIPKHESICQPTAQTVNPVEIEIFEGIEGRSDSSFVSRRLQMVSLNAQQKASLYESSCGSN